MRAYATNNAGTEYGPEVMFITYKADAITDIDNNYYNIVTIGSQTWLAENLKTTRFNDGTEIPLVTDNVAWTALTTPGYCWYNNDPVTNKVTYGALYNWYAVDALSTGGRNICPAGWHPSDDSEWTTLVTFLGGADIAGNKLRETGTSHWTSPNSGATNETGFKGLPAGYRGTIFNFIQSYGIWWSYSGSNMGSELYRDMSSNSSALNRGQIVKQSGLSVRCIKDN